MPTSTIPVTPIVTRSITSRRMPATSTVSNTHPGPGKDCGDGETVIAHTACDSCSRANDVSSSVNGLAPRTQRNATRSVSTEATTAASTIAGASTHHPSPRVDRK